jgi:hypothetical protein
MTIFAGALCLRLWVTFGWGLALGRDGPYHLYHLQYLLEHWPSVQVSATHQFFFHFAAGVHALLSPFGSSLMSSFNIGTSLGSALVVLTTFLMMRRLTKNTATALVAAFFSGFVPASFRIFGELQKNALGVSLTPLAVLFFWRGVEGRKKLDLLLAGVVLGLVGLTHELAFGTLIIAYVSYLSLLLAYRRRIPWREIKCMVVVAVFTAIICGHFYAVRLGTIGSMAGEEEMEQPPEGPPPEGPSPPEEFQAAGMTAREPPPENEPPPEGPPREERSVYQFYDEYIGQPLFILAAFGVGACVYRRKPADLFLLAWVMSALVMAQPWVARGYEWRFPLMLATPVVLLAAVGLIEGIGGFLWKIGNATRSSPKNPRAHTITGRRVVFLLLLAVVVAHQVQTSNTYAWTGEMLQPTITRGQYEALVEFYEEFGSVYAFRVGRYPVYWPDAVGLKSDIAGGEVISNLSEMARGDFEEASVRLAREWDNRQRGAGENIYALMIPGDPDAQLLEDGRWFEVCFDRGELRVYALREGITLPAIQETSQPPANGDGLLFEKEKKPPGEGDPAHKLLLAPVYLLEGWLRFIPGVPLTIFMWVFIVCLLWEVIRRATGEGSELIRKPLALVLVCVLVLASVALVKGYERLKEPPPEGVQPEGLPHRILSAQSVDGLNWTKDNRMVADRASVPDAVFDGENIRVYYSKLDIRVAISKDGVSWEEREVVIAGLAEGEGRVDPDVVILPDGRYRMYIYVSPITEEDPALIPGPHEIRSAISDDGINFQLEPGVRYEAEKITDPDVIQMGDVWRMFLSEGPRTISTVSHDNGLSFSFERPLPIDGAVTCTIPVPGGYRMYYHGAGDPPRIYSAFSSDGEIWLKDDGVRLEAGAPGSLDEKGVEAPAVVRLQDGSYRMFYVSRYG